MAGSKAIGYGAELQLATNTTTPSYTAVTKIRSISGPSADTDRVECTTFDSANNTREYLLSLIDPGELSLELAWIPDEQTHVDLTTYQTGRTSLAWKVVFPTTTQTCNGLGYVGSLGPEIPLDDLITMSVGMQLTGPITWPTTT